MTSEGPLGAMYLVGRRFGQCGLQALWVGLSRWPSSSSPGRVGICPKEVPGRVQEGARPDQPRPWGTLWDLDSMLTEEDLGSLQAEEWFGLSWVLKSGCWLGIDCDVLGVWKGQHRSRGLLEMSQDGHSQWVRSGQIPGPLGPCVLPSSEMRKTVGAFALWGSTGSPFGLGAARQTAGCR